MKSVLLSIKPKYCELIAGGKKTIEVRKTKPKLDTPFKCYIYCTKDKNISFWTSKRYSYADDRSHNLFDVCGNGKVMGEFVCDKITEFYPTMDLKRLTSNHIQMVDKSCVNMRDLYNYANDKILYAWQISDLVIYDEPKDIDVFEKPCSHDCKNCEYWYSGSPIDYEPPYCEWEDCVITRPPQSWCYVEEVEEHE